MLDKTYRPAEIEAKFDRLWQERGHFAPSDDPGLIDHGRTSAAGHNWSN